MKAQFLTLLAVFGIAVSAAPLAAPEAAQFDWVDSKDVAEHFDGGSSRLMSRTVGGIYICTDEHWKGTCGYKVQPLDVCIHLDAPWYHTISSFGPDKGTKCNWYSDYNCASQVANDIQHPGIEDMDTPNHCDGKKRGEALDKRCWGNKVGSFKCWAT